MMILAAIVLCFVVCLAPLLFLRNEPVRPAPIRQEALDKAVEAFSSEPPKDLPAAEPQTDVTIKDVIPQETDIGSNDPPRGDIDISTSLDLKTNYQWLVRLLVPFQIVLFLSFAAFWVVAFHSLGQAHAAGFPPSIVLFKPVYGAYFALSGIFMGIFSAAVCEGYLLRLLLGGRRYTEYRQWEQARFGVHGQRGAQGLKGLFTVGGLIVAIPTAAMIPLVMNWSTRFDESGISIRPLWSFTEEARSYDDVKTIIHSTHARYKGKMIETPGLYLEFNNGQTWENGSLYPADHREGINRLLQLLRRKTAVPIQIVRLR